MNRKKKIFLSLALLFTSSILIFQLSQKSFNNNNPTTCTITAFFKLESSPSDHQKLVNQITGKYPNLLAEYLSSEEGYNKYLQSISDQPELIQIIKQNSPTIPATLTIKTCQQEQNKQLKDFLNNHPLIEQIIEDDSATDP